MVWTIVANDACLWRDTIDAVWTKTKRRHERRAERFRRRVLHVRRVLSDSSTTSFTLVTIPERMGVMKRLANQSLGEYDLPVTGCLVNRVTPELDHPFLHDVAPKSKVIFRNWKKHSTYQ